MVLAGWWLAYIARRIMSPSGFDLSLYLCHSDTQIPRPRDHGTEGRLKTHKKAKTYSHAVG